MTTIDIHIIQSVPPSNINRDDNGSPKTAVYGGVRRARVSSQSWKRAVRLSYMDILDSDNLGVRTKRAAELIAKRIRELRPETSTENAINGAWGALAGLGLKPDKKPKKTEADGSPDSVGTTQYLVFFSNPQLDALADLAIQNDFEKVPAKEAKAAASVDHGISLALFGRMVADDPELNVDASVQVAHALSTHAVDPEFDFYTAVDDHNPDSDTGAGMMGGIEFNSSTMYRYATIMVDGLHKTLGDVEATARAAEAFVAGFVRSMPSGKQNTFANGTLPHGVVVTVREGRGVNLVGAFEEAVPVSDEGYLGNSCERLAAHATELQTAFGDEPLTSWVTVVGDKNSALESMGTRVAFPDLVSELGSFIRTHLGQPA